jgi:hypothetical protein
MRVESRKPKPEAGRQNRSSSFVAEGLAVVVAS